MKKSDIKLQEATHSTKLHRSNDLCETVIWHQGHPSYGTVRLALALPLRGAGLLEVDEEVSARGCGEATAQVTNEDLYTPGKDLHW